MLLCHALGIVFRNAPEANQITPDYKAVAPEVKFVNVLKPGVFLVPHQGEGVNKVLFQRENLRLCYRDNYFILKHLASVLLNKLQSVIE